jgi:glycopeptide antibiotics resistance protein
VLLVVYCVALALIAFWPGNVDEGIKDALTRTLSVLDQPWLTYRLVERAANVLLFVPLALLIALSISPKRWWIALLACVVLSLAIELIQGALLPGRVISNSDVVQNTAGAIIGIALSRIRALRSPGSAA